MTIRRLVAGTFRVEGASSGAWRSRTAWASFFKRFLGAVLASAAMFHGPAFSADPEPPKVGADE